jgi:PPP family 3-phenylpropionic acid transporter
MLQSTFGALIWKQAGVPEWALGPLWALGPGGEIVVMLFFGRLVKRFSARHIILFASVVTVVRWIGFASQPPLWGLFLLQLLNMATFGLSYLGIISFIANWTTEAIAAETQAFFQVIRQVVTVAALVGFGYLVAHFDVGAYYGAAALGLAGAVLTTGSLMLMRTRHE